MDKKLLFVKSKCVICWWWCWSTEPEPRRKLMRCCREEDETPGWAEDHNHNNLGFHHTLTELSCLKHQNEKLHLSHVSPRCISRNLIKGKYRETAESYQVADNNFITLCCCEDPFIYQPVSYLCTMGHFAERHFSPFHVIRKEEETKFPSLRTESLLCKTS